MTRVRHIRLIALIAAIFVVAVTAAASGTASALASARPLNLHHVKWGDEAVPGQVCRVNGPIRLHDGLAKLNHSGYGPLDVSVTGPFYGDLGGGQQVAAVQVLCSNQGGTAAGQLADSIVVFSGAGGKLHSLGVLTPQYRPHAPVHIPFITVARVGAGHIVTTEYWYTSNDPDCCPSGRATTTWSWNGHRFTPGHTTITGR
jgi:hypothetical protein